MWLQRMPAEVRAACHCEDRIPHASLMELLGRARAMIATSISDGTPNVMLDAMAAGAIPVMSPLDSIQEWIEDGRNGLLAHALYPEQIAAALRRALQDDDLYQSARRINQDLLRSRADRQKIQPRVLDYYRSLLVGR